MELEDGDGNYSDDTQDESVDISDEFYSRGDCDDEEPEDDVHIKDEIG